MHTSTSSNSENLPPRTIARVAREVRNLHKSPPGGIRLVVDPETGCAESLGEIYVSIPMTYSLTLFNMVYLSKTIFKFGI